MIGTGGVPTETFEYDHASQRILGPHGPTSHDAMCRPLTNAGSSYSYDGLGNRLRQRGDGGEVLYSWTGPNLLSSVTLPNGSVVHYLYDAHGRRVRKVTPDEQVTYVWAGSQLVQEIHERGSERATIEYLYLPEDFRPLAKSEGGRVYYYHCDHLGTPQHLSDIAAQLVWSATYSAFGDTSPSVAVVGQPLRFLGQYWDAETGLHYNRARYYDPALGVYISRDPLAPIGENAYLYARGNPVTGTDPFGLFWESAPGWVKTTVAVAGGIAVGVAVGAAVVAAAPLLGVAAGVAGIAAVIAAGAAGGAAMGGLDAAMTEGGCVLCGMGRGAVIGAIAAIPFAFLPATAGALAFAGVGAASGAVGYFADLAIFGGEFSWGDLGIAMAAGTVFGVAGKYVGGAIAKALGRKGSAGAPGGKTPPEHAGKPTEGGARPDAETPRERARRKLEENQRQAREREAAADRERKQKNKEDGELKRKRGEEAEAISLEDARNHPDRDPNTSVHASEKEIQRDLGIPNDADGNQPKLPDNSITKTDGTQRFTETKNETQTNASEVREKFETVSQSDKYPDQEYVLEMWEGGEYSDPAYSTGPDGTLHHNGEQVTVGDRPIHVVQKPFPR